MAIKNFVIGGFREEPEIFEAVRKVRLSGYKLHDVYAPYPVHGLDEAMGLRGTSIHTAGFVYGLLGTLTALCGMGFCTAISWQLDIDGKPHFPLAAFIPITFELTVLFSSVGMVITYCWLNQMMPGVKKHLFHPRQTDDLFVVVIELTGKTTAAEVKAFFESLGAIDIGEQRAEAGWWYGNFAAPEPYQQTDMPREATVG